MPDQTLPRHNSDLALHPSHQHTHEHTHHAAATEDEPVYTKDTTIDPTVIPHQSNLHRHSSSSKVASSTAKPVHPPTYVAADADPEKGDVKDREQLTALQPSDVRVSSYSRLYRRYRVYVHLLIFAFFTGWWIATLVLHRHDKNWVIPFLLWLFITIRLVFFHISSSLISRPIKKAWTLSAVAIYERLPPRWRTPLGTLVTVGAILLGAFVPGETAENTRENRAVSLFGLLVLIFVLWLTSRKRSAIQWRTVVGGMLAQYVIALFVLKTGVGYDIFNFIAARAGDLLGFSKLGVAFLTNDDTANLTWFVLNVIPAIIFFVSIVQVLYYIGFLQWFIRKTATFVFWALRVSGAEAVVAAATPFIGQGESAMLVSPFIPHMTPAELHQVMTCGFATISGSVLVAYVGLGLNPQALVSSCIMSIPASLAISKMRYPETEETLTAGKVVIPDDAEHEAENALHAYANGAWFGLKIAGTIISSIICILAAVGLVDGLMTWWGRYLNISNPDLTLELLMSYICFPIAFLLGVPRQGGEIWAVAKIISTKIIKNEFVAFLALQNAALSPRSTLIATYAICGFGNIGSLGIQIGILSQIAPSRGGDVARVALSALVSGVLSTLTSAAMAGLLITNQEALVPSS